nr:MMPL family transporter [Tessaracoccus coleopterorum]
MVALGIDYNIFLMTRVREESVRHGTREGVLRGLAVTGGVITSAGIVLAATFAALAVLPILFLLQLAFIVAFGVLLDTFVVRTLLVPALVYDIGPAVWWPSRLSRSHPRGPTRPRGTPARKLGAMINGIVVRESGVQLETYDESFLGDGDVLVDVVYSDLNFKDALAVTGRPGVVRTTPWLPGSTWSAPSRSLTTRGGSPATGSSRTARDSPRPGTAASPPVPGSTRSWPSPSRGPLPVSVAALGTAGYTAALAVLKIVGEGVVPGDGPCW